MSSHINEAPQPLHCTKNGNAPALASKPPTILGSICTADNVGILVGADATVDFDIKKMRMEDRMKEYEEKTMFEIVVVDSIMCFVKSRFVSVVT